MFRQGRIRNFERVSRVSHWFRGRFTPAGRLILAVIIASGVIGVDISRNLTYQIFSLSVSLIGLAVIFAAFNRCKFSCTRTLPPIATVGEPVHYHIDITNETSTLQSDLLVVDQLELQSPTEQELHLFRDPQSVHENRFDRIVGFPRWDRLAKIKTGAEVPSQRLTKMSANETVKLKLSLTPLRRGYIRFQGVNVGCPDISGIFRSVYRQTIKEALLVLPKRYPVPYIQLPGHRQHHQGGVSMSSSVGEAAEFHGLRDYRPGDPLRHIHWRSWARTGKPVVKKYEDEYFVRHALILDTYGQSANTPQFEEAVSVAASLVLNVADQESLLDLMFVDRRAYRFTTGRHTADVQYLLEILACVNPEYHQSFETLAQLVRHHSGQLSSAICVLLQWDESRKTLVNALRVLGINVVVIIVTETAHTKTEKDGLGSMDGQQHYIHWVQVGDIEQGLVRLAHVQGGFS